MTQKPKIQYVGQFYVYGSEARAVELASQPKKPKHPLPLERLEKIEKLYVDPVALIAIAVSVIMLVTMFIGVQQIRRDWAEYEVMAQRVHTLREYTHTKTEEFRGTYTLADIRVKAAAMGMVPKAEAEHKVVQVIRPEPVQEPTWMDNLQWFVKGLFA